MQEVFNNIVEKFQSKIEALGGASGSNEVQDVAVKEIEWCKEIVEKFAEEFATDTNVGSNGWIPCSSGVLPKRPNSYCVTKMCENDGNPIYETCHEIFWTNDNKWDCERDEDCEWRVIAWKEKDKPYQPEGE